MKNGKEAVRPTTRRHLFTEEQLLRVRELLDSALLTAPKTGDMRTNLRLLKEELEKVKAVTPDQMPPDVVRIGSWIEVEDLSDGEVDIYQIVTPESADLIEGRISLLTPLGIAALGRRQGDCVRFEAPGGAKKILIRQVSAEPIAETRKDT